MRAERADEQLQSAREELIKLKSKHQQALEDASSAKAELEAARTAADKAKTSLIQDASTHKARADEAESARMKASQRAVSAMMQRRRMMTNTQMSLRMISIMRINVAILTVVPRRNLKNRSQCNRRTRAARGVG